MVWDKPKHVAILNN